MAQLFIQRQGIDVFCELRACHTIVALSSEWCQIYCRVGEELENSFKKFDGGTQVLNLCSDHGI